MDDEDRKLFEAMIDRIHLMAGESQQRTASLEQLRQSLEGVTQVVRQHIEAITPLLQ